MGGGVNGTPAARHESSRPRFVREMRSGLRLIFAWRPDRRAAGCEGLAFHCHDAVVRWLKSADDFDPEPCPLTHRRFDCWEQAEAWLREDG